MTKTSPNHQRSPRITNIELPILTLHTRPFSHETQSNSSQILISRGTFHIYIYNKPIHPFISIHLSPNHILPSRIWLNNTPITSLLPILPKRQNLKGVYIVKQTPKNRSTDYKMKKEKKKKGVRNERICLESLPACLPAFSFHHQPAS